MTTLSQGTAPLLDRRAQSVTRGVASAHPVFVERAKGVRLWDVEGREYIDFAAGIGVLNVGHNHPHVVEAVRDQAERYLHTCFQVVMYEPYVRLAGELCQLVGGRAPFKAFFATTGAEAVENAVKVARAATGRQAIIAYAGGFHGRTLMGMTLTGMSAPYRQSFGPFAPEIYQAPYPYEYRGWTTERALASLHELFATVVLPDRVAAVVIEPEQGDGGFVPAPAGYLRALRDLTAKHGILLVCDEVQSGFGRTGRMFGYQHADIEPDLVVLAKGLAGGLPLSAVVGKAALMDAPEPGGLGGTYAGSPIACAAALAVLDLMRDGSLLRRAEALGRILRAGLEALQKDYECVGDVRGLGAMLAMELVVDRRTHQPDADLTSRVLEQARKRGLIVIKCGVYRNVVRLLPPLVATDADAEQAMHILRASLAAALQEGQRQA